MLSDFNSPHVVHGDVQSCQRRVFLTIPNAHAFRTQQLARRQRTLIAAGIRICQFADQQCQVQFSFNELRYSQYSALRCCIKWINTRA